MSGTGTIAPANRTCGKHSIGSAKVACATSVTAAEASRPRASAASASSVRVTRSAA